MIDIGPGHDFFEPRSFKTVLQDARLRRFINEPLEICLVAGQRRYVFVADSLNRIHLLGCAESDSRKPEQTVCYTPIYSLALKRRPIHMEVVETPEANSCQQSHLVVIECGKRPDEFSQLYWRIYRLIPPLTSESPAAQRSSRVFDSTVMKPMAEIRERILPISKELAVETITAVGVDRGLDWIAVGHTTGHVTIYQDKKSGKVATETLNPDHGAPITCLIIAPSENSVVLVIATVNSILAVDLDTKSTIWSERTLGCPQHCLAWSPKNEIIYAVSLVGVHLLHPREGNISGCASTNSVCYYPVSLTLFKDSDPVITFAIVKDLSKAEDDTGLSTTLELVKPPVPLVVSQSIDSRIVASREFLIQVVTFTSEYKFGTGLFPFSNVSHVVHALDGVLILTSKSLLEELGPSPDSKPEGSWLSELSLKTRVRILAQRKLWNHALTLALDEDSTKSLAKLVLRLQFAAIASGQEPALHTRLGRGGYDGIQDSSPGCSPLSAFDDCISLFMETVKNPQLCGLTSVEFFLTFMLSELEYTYATQKDWIKFLETLLQGLFHYFAAGLAKKWYVVLLVECVVELDRVYASMRRPSILELEDGTVPVFVVSAPHKDTLTQKLSKELFASPFFRPIALSASLVGAIIGSSAAKSTLLRSRSPHLISSWYLCSDDLQGWLKNNDDPLVALEGLKIIAKKSLPTALRMCVNDLYLDIGLTEDEWMAFGVPLGKKWVELYERIAESERLAVSERTLFFDATYKLWWTMRERRELIGVRSCVDDSSYIGPKELMNELESKWLRLEFVGFVLSSHIEFVVARTLLAGYKSISQVEHQRIFLSTVRESAATAVQELASVESDGGKKLLKLIEEQEIPTVPPTKAASNSCLMVPARDSKTASRCTLWEASATLFR